MSDTPVNLSAILSALGTNVKGKLSRAANRRAVTTKMLRAIPAIGKNVTWDVNTTGAVVEGYSDADAVSNFGSDAVIQPTLSWGLRRSNYRVGDVAMRVAAAQGANPTWAMKLDEKTLTDAITALTSNINSQIFSGTGVSPQLAGLAIAIKADNTYAGIDRTDSANALFRSNVIDPGTDTTLTVEQIRSDVGSTIYDACGEQPDIAICSSAVFNKVAALFDPNRRYDQDVRVNTLDGREIVLDASYQKLVVENCTFIKDKDCTANAIYYLNSQHVWLEYLPVMAPPGFEVEQANDGFEALSLGMGLARLGKRSASTDFTLDCNVQLVVDNPIFCGKRLHVATT